jgi:ABC-type multidrug transport system fused ATPase/permease subunit
MLPNKYDTMVWDRWVKLSWWQKQRIAIARAILKDSPIFLLDEATSALDSESESKVQESLHSLIEWKTVIAIAHRLSTLLLMDKIVVMSKWKIVESWSHKELLSKNWIYTKLWNMQSGWFIPEVDLLEY